MVKISKANVPVALKSFILDPIPRIGLKFSAKPIKYKAILNDVAINKV